MQWFLIRWMKRASFKFFEQHKSAYRASEDIIMLVIVVVNEPSCSIDCYGKVTTKKKEKSKKTTITTNSEVFALLYWVCKSLRF